jgi:BirA family biotin operon repressor/biotin-[acetyl-CoA-carboxylase] ligase
MDVLTTAILRFDSLPSTNLEAAQRAIDGAEEGLCVVAAEQTQGRGRLGRQWASPKGAGLYFSILFRPTFPQASWPLLTLMAAVAVQDALSQSCDLPTDIKWPNDVIAGEKKLCGILAETVETRMGSAVVVGIGINLNQNSFPPELNDVATSVEAVSKKPANAELVTESLVRALSNHYRKLQMQDGLTKLVNDWCSRSSYCRGKRITVAEGADSFVGTTRGVEKDGALIVETDNGELKVVRAGDVSSVRPASEA